MQTSSQHNPQNWLSRLADSGYRITSPRRAVVEILASASRAVTAMDIFDLARQRVPSIGLVSIYRTLEKLEELNLVQRVHQPQSCQAYIAAFTGHEHLLLCQECGKLQFFAGDNLAPLVQRVEAETGYRVNDHWLQLFGICPKCQN